MDPSCFASPGSTTSMVLCVGAIDVSRLSNVFTRTQPKSLKICDLLKSMPVGVFIADADSLFRS